jgi:hypothetical protein
MIWARQKQRVDQLSALAGERRRTAKRLRAAFASWTRSTFGSPTGLALSFAVGSLWAASGSRSALRKSRLARAIVNSVNTSWLLWRVVGRKVSLAAGEK